MIHELLKSYHGHLDVTETVQIDPTWFKYWVKRLMIVCDKYNL